MTLDVDLDQLRILTQAFNAWLASDAGLESGEGTEELPGLVQYLLDQAQAQMGRARFAIPIAADQAAALRSALESLLPEVAETEDIFLLGELQALVGQLGAERF